MAALPLALVSSGMVTSVGSSLDASVASIRCGLSNAQETRFIDWGGEWIRAHTVDIACVNARDKHVQMAAMAIDECLNDARGTPTGKLHLVLCVAEPDRPGRMDGIDETLVPDIQHALGSRFAAGSSVVMLGRVGAFVGMNHARALLADGQADAVVLVGVDSLVTWPTLQGFEGQGRLLTSQQSNGFLPGEASCALLVTAVRNGQHLICHGIGFGTEPSTVLAEAPLRGEALANAVRGAVAEAGWDSADIDFQIADLSGEQYFFREAALARARFSRRNTDQLELWHPAESIGEVGAAAGPVVLAIAMAASAKDYAPGRKVLCHVSSDAGQRTAAVLHRGTAT